MTITFNATSELPTRFGHFKLDIFTDKKGTEYLAISSGTPRNGCLVRLHSECATGDILGSLRCDCRDQLELALRKISETKNGLVIYLRGQEGRGIGLANKIKAYALQDKGQDTVDANISLGFVVDERTYDTAIAILKYYNLSEIQVMTNNRQKIEAIEKAGIKIARHIPLWTTTNPYNESYIATKQRRMGHITSDKNT